MCKRTRISEMSPSRRLSNERVSVARASLEVPSGVSSMIRVFSSGVIQPVSEGPALITLVEMPRFVNSCAAAMVI